MTMHSPTYHAPVHGDHTPTPEFSHAPLWQNLLIILVILFALLLAHLAGLLQFRNAPPPLSTPPQPSQAVVLPAS